MFYITNDKSKCKEIENNWSKLYGNSICFNIGHANIIVSSGYSKHVIKRVTDCGYIFGLGTFFCDSGFGERVLNQISSLKDLERIQSKGLFGHYTFIIQDLDGIYVVTDKIGMLNVYYVPESNYFHISDDLVQLSISSGNTKLSESGVKQFLNRESTVGEITLFKNIKRLGLGNRLLIRDGLVSEDRFYNYDCEKLSESEYIERVNHYFTLINKFDGRITSDLSAGYDTRLVVSCSHRCIQDFRANTNPNQFDNGLDVSVSRTISNKLGIGLDIIPNSPIKTLDIEWLLHVTNAGRNIFRSKQFQERLKNKYNKFDLVIGGYGGEVVRANYNQSKIEEYYQLAKIDRLFKSESYSQLVLSEISKYPKIESSNQYTNVIYTVDKMRIWGGVYLSLSSIYGSALHPFMDWHLVNPIFMMDDNELKGGKFQDKLILHFSPSLKGIPINSLSTVNSYFHRVKSFVKSKLKRLNAVEKILFSFRSKTNNKKLNELYQVRSRDTLNKDLLSELNIDLDLLEAKHELVMIDRLYTINALNEYLKSNLEN